MVTTAKRYTPAEYLAQEKNSDVRHELIESGVFRMAGASANHNRISLNFCRLFPLEIQGQRYEIFMSDMRLWLPAYESYTYPDVMVIRGEPRFTDSGQTAVTNPCLIMEVLSPSTEGYDKSAKFRLYRSLLDFEEYLLVDQATHYVEQFTKVDEQRWLLTERVGEASVLALQSMAVEMRLKNLYDRVRFEPKAVE
ncbi:MAG: Uma2 family endonuclease [Elainellaceae cyanobacterium]